MQRQSVLVTGASSGLGHCLWTAFLTFDHRVCGTALPGECGGSFKPWDAMDEASTDRLIENFNRLEMKFDIVIHNAGINAIRPFEAVTAEFLHEVMHVNCIAPILFTQKLLAAGLLRSGARLCHVISDAAWRPMRHSLAYNMSKAALDMATKQMARELTKSRGLTIFGVRPGKMRGTGMSQYIDKQVQTLRGWSAEEAATYAANNSVSGQEFSPFEVSQLIYHLCTSHLPLSGACMDLAG